MVAQDGPNGGDYDNANEVPVRSEVRNAGVRIRMTRLGKGMRAASTREDQKTTA
jgi:hypothetical protein